MKKLYQANTNKKMVSLYQMNSLSQKKKLLGLKGDNT